MAPLASLRPCNIKACRELTREKYCEEHKVQHANKSWGGKTVTQAIAEINNRIEPKQKVEPSVYSTPKWKVIRKKKLRSSIRCEAYGCISTATEVDHITPISEGGAAYDMRNLQSLCKSCHARKTGREVKQRQLARAQQRGQAGSA